MFDVELKARSFKEITDKLRPVVGSNDRFLTYRVELAFKKSGF